MHPWADALLPEPLEDLGRMAPAGQLWSTTGDLARFAAFLAGGDDRVLSAESVREMRTPAAPAEAADVVDGATYGLGMQIQQRDGRLFVGHSGSLPGFLANLTISVEDDVAAVVLANCTSGPLLGAVGADLVRIVAEAEPRIPEPWRPLREVDRDVLDLAGQWFWGTHAFALRATADGLLALGPLTGGGRRARFRSNDDGTWTGLEGYYAGELLRPVRRPDGSVIHLDLGSFVFTRQPYEEGPRCPAEWIRRAGGGSRSRWLAGRVGVSRETPTPGRFSELELETHVRGGEAEAFVETVGVRAAAVGGQLHQLAVLAPGFLDGPLDELGAQAAPALVGVDADGLDDRAGRSLAGEPGDERQLEGADDTTLPHRRDELLVRVRVQPLQGRQVRRQVVG